MSRLIPAQLQAWSKGTLVQSEQVKQLSDRFYRGISTDTRTLRRGQVFLALKGPNFDGHDFVSKAIEGGALMLVLNRETMVAKELTERLQRGEDLPDLLLVDDTLKAYQAIAEGYRLTLLATVVGITGSVGKTTTRRMTSAVMNTQMKVHQTKENLNNQIGLPLTLLQADDADDVIVAEMGMDHRGEIGILSKTAHPDIAIITSIGYSHAEYLGSREEILKEKTDIIRGLKKNGLVLINGQDEFLHEWALQNNEQTIWRIVNSKAEVEAKGLGDLPVFWAEDLRIGHFSTEFIAKTSLDLNEAWPVKIPCPGKHLVRAALFGLAAAYALGLDMTQAVQGCSEFSNTGNRQRIVELDGVLLIDDSYNSSPESNTSALDTLQLIAEQRQGKRFVCISGMKELGQYSAEMHRMIGEKLAQMELEHIYLVGEESAWIAEVLANKISDDKFTLCADSQAVKMQIKDRVHTGDTVLIKGSRFYKMEVIAQGLEGR